MQIQCDANDCLWVKKRPEILYREALPYLSSFNYRLSLVNADY